MKAVLTGGSGPLSPDDLRKLNWTFPEKSVAAGWFTPTEHDTPAPGETLLFYGAYHGTTKGPHVLEYTVSEETAPLIRGRSLVVGHDDSARHMIRDHVLPFLSLFGWVLLVWGALWLLVLFFLLAKRKRPRETPEAS